MEFFTKISVFLLLLVGIYGSSLRFERNIFNHSEENSYSNCSCNLRYFKHYEVKGCIVEAEDSCGCPKKFNCIFNETLHTSSKVCIYQNKEYKVGSKIITSDDCKVCRCREGIPPYISCTNKECPQINYATEKKCHLIYSENKCCPINQECVDNENETGIIRNETSTCEYNGKIYPVGARIYPVDDPCQICLCNENWSGIDNISCYQHECMFENNKAKLDEGCIPVYHENKCCPIEFYCPSSHNASFSSILDNETTESNITSGNDELCLFGGQFYELGMELSIGNPCVKCSCLVPPDFTCVHQSCPLPPSYENCYPNYKPEVCCPGYECLFGDAESVPDGCPTPICADSSCHIEIPPGHECPTCICNDSSSFLEQNTVQQIQQVSQNVENMQDEFEGPRQVVDDYSEEELQMLPIGNQDTKGQSSLFEKMIEAEPEENNKNMPGEEKVNSTHESENITEIEEPSTLSSVNSESNNNSLESNSSESEKNIQKRSNFHSGFPHIQQQNTFVQQQGMFHTDNEREFESSDKDDGDFDDELESFKNKVFNNNGTAVNEITDSTEAEIVPPGCPTPMCEGPWCKIGIPVGETCPTCICRRHVGGEP